MILLRLAGLSALLLLAACRDHSVTSYRIPKEAQPAAPVQPAGHPAAPTAPPGPGAMSGTVPTAGGTDLVWTAPATWRTKAGASMRKGSYVIGPESGPTADLAITAFPGDVGGDLANVNRWRGQLQLGPITAAELPAAVHHFDANGLHVNVVDLTNGTQRMLAAFIPYEGATWFVKLTGPDALVAAEKPTFLAFLETLRPPQ